MDPLTATVCFVFVTNIVIMPEVGWRPAPCPDKSLGNIGCLVYHSESYPLPNPSYRDVVTTVYRHQVVTVKDLTSWTNKTEIVSKDTVREIPVLTWTPVSTNAGPNPLGFTTNLINSGFIQFKTYP